MCRLGGEFAGILRVDVAAERRAALEAALRGLEARGLSVVVRPDECAPPAPGARLAAIELMGQDRPGIVRQITAALAAQGVNVEELSTECVSAPMSGETLFKAKARLLLSAACDEAALRRELEKCAADLLVDVSFAEIGERA